MKWNAKMSKWELSLPTENVQFAPFHQIEYKWILYSAMLILHVCVLIYKWILCDSSTRLQLLTEASWFGLEPKVLGLIPVLQGLGSSTKYLVMYVSQTSGLLGLKRFVTQEKSCIDCFRFTPLPGRWLCIVCVVDHSCRRSYDIGTTGGPTVPVEVMVTPIEGILVATLHLWIKSSSVKVCSYRWLLHWSNIFSFEMTYLCVV